VSIIAATLVGNGAASLSGAGAVIPVSAGANAALTNFVAASAVVDIGTNFANQRSSLFSRGQLQSTAKKCFQSWGGGF
jgi:hypothetical protein